MELGMKATENDIKYLPGVGPKRAALLQKELGIRTFGDLIHFYPYRYIDRSTVVPIADIIPDMAYIQVKAKVLSRELYGTAGAIFQDGARQGSIGGDGQGQLPESGNGTLPENFRFTSAKRLRVLVMDSTGILEIVFFKGLKWSFEKLVPGKEFIFFGKPSVFNGHVNLVHPDIDDVPQQPGNAEKEGQKAAGLMAPAAMTGIYPSTDSLRNSGITAKVMNRLQAAALNATLIDVRESLPDYILKDNGLVPIHFALRNIHFPSGQDALAKARYRLKFEELFYLQLSLLKQKYMQVEYCSFPHASVHRDSQEIQFRYAAVLQENRRHLHLHLPCLKTRARVCPSLHARREARRS